MTTKSAAIGLTDRFIADTHFGHAGILRHAARPWSDIEAHDRDLIAHWNSVVGTRDVVWHLGDFAYWKMPLDRVKGIFKKLHGVPRLIVGNHETEAICRELAWDSVDEVRILHAADLKVVLCHYPMREWPHWWQGSIHLHGHTHGHLPSSRRSWDCGVDNQGFVPLTFAEIRARMSSRPELDFGGVEVEVFVPRRDGKIPESTS